MPLKYKAIQKTEPGVKGGGTKHWYASPAERDEINIERISRDFERLSSLSLSDVRAVLIALTEVIPDYLADGNIVRLGELGDLRVALSSVGTAKEADVTANLIKDAHINFRPGDALKKVTIGLTYQKV